MAYCLCIETEEQSSTVFVTRFEASPDGPKATSTKVTDVQGVLVEEVLSEPEQEESSVPDTSEVTIEEVIDTEGKSYCTIGNGNYAMIDVYQPQNYFNKAYKHTKYTQTMHHTTPRHPLTPVYKQLKHYPPNRHTNTIHKTNQNTQIVQTTYRTR